MEKQWIPILFAVIASFFLAGIIMLLAVRPQRTAVIISTREPAPDLSYEIFGAIEKPGTYTNRTQLRVSTAVAMAGGFTDQADIQSSRLSSWIADGDTIIIPTSGALAPTLTLPAMTEELIDINSADAEMFDQLPGIGEKKAADIVKLRQEKNGFKSVDELLEVPGISQNMLEKFYDRLFISQPEQ